MVHFSVHKVRPSEIHSIVRPRGLVRHNYKTIAVLAYEILLHTSVGEWPQTPRSDIS